MSSDDDQLRTASTLPSVKAAWAEGFRAGVAAGPTAYLEGDEQPEQRTASPTPVDAGHETCVDFRCEADPMRRPT